MNFRVGMKLVCVDAVFADCYIQLNLPVYRGVYTVRDIVMGLGLDGLGPGLVFEEIQNPVGPLGTEYSFVAERFRPLVERKTDISNFEKMLTGENVNV